jgi:hypothetical protein
MEMRVTISFRNSALKIPQVGAILRLSLQFYEDYCLLGCDSV